ncbi:MAG: helix-turn-helix transcriptional regulator [Alphaproteobacteria bacterium]|jgi:transcriptional regulator with XRE-family HTH domain|nr:helix-turn-helix transcriptional regulator [Alphaproteobacteria bacterium]MDP3533582.1 helix-turn-helix transcriptional regulator [Alphaproteobacteria bacterium]
MNSSPHLVDIYVGARLRARRTLLGMTQENLGEAVSLTFQQIQKYERGTNRIVASRLYEFAKVLNVQVSYFFDGFESTVSKSGVKEEKTDYEIEPILTRSSIELIRKYSSISDPSKKKLVQDLVKTLSFQEDE